MRSLTVESLPFQIVFPAQFLPAEQDLRDSTVVRLEAVGLIELVWTFDDADYAPVFASEFVCTQRKTGHQDLKTKSCPKFEF
jgi:hypothetical protein